MLVTAEKSQLRKTATHIKKLPELITIHRKFRAVIVTRADIDKNYPTLFGKGVFVYLAAETKLHIGCNHSRSGFVGFVYIDVITPIGGYHLEKLVHQLISVHIAIVQWLYILIRLKRSNDTDRNLVAHHFVFIISALGEILFIAQDCNILIAGHDGEIAATEATCQLLRLNTIVGILVYKLREQECLQRSDVHAIT